MHAHTRAHIHTHTHTHVAVDTNIVVFRPSEPHQYSINILTQAKLRESIHRIDPQGVVERRSVAVKRRVYHVECPNGEAKTLRCGE